MSALELDLLRAHEQLSRAGITAYDEDGLAVGLPVRVSILAEERDRALQVLKNGMKCESGLDGDEIEALRNDESAP